jgi:hypothetical protein
VKKGGGFVMKRFQCTFGDALREEVEKEEAEKVNMEENEGRWKMVMLQVGSGE